MYRPPVKLLLEQADLANGIIRSMGGTVGVSIMIDKETGVLLDIKAVPFPGYAIPPKVPERPDVSRVFRRGPDKNRAWKKRR